MCVYRSEDAGQTWELVSGGDDGWGPPGVRAGYPIDMQCDPRDTSRVFTNNYLGGNFLSEDGGRTWVNASQGYTGAQIRSVAVDPSEPGRIYASGRSGVWRCDSGGSAWYSPLANTEHTTTMAECWAIALDPSRPGHVFASGGDGVLVSENGGRTWQIRWPQGPLPGGFAVHISSYAFAPSSPTTVYAGTVELNCEVSPETDCRGVGVIASRDGGTSWELTADDQFQGVPVLDVAVDPTDAQVVYAATGTGLFKSVDGGAAWTQVSGLPEKKRVHTVAVSPTDPQYVLAGVGEGGGIRVSTDGGQTWQEGIAGLEPNSDLRDIVFDPTNGSVVYTSDRASGVYRSTDGGLTWIAVNDGLRNRSAVGLSISADGQHLYVGTDGEGVFRLDISGEPPPEAEGLEDGADEEGEEDEGGEEGDGTEEGSIIETAPENGATDVPLDASIIITFDRPVVPNSLDVHMEPDIPWSERAWSEDNTAVTLTLTRPLEPEVTYAVTVHGLLFEDDSELSEPFLFRFTTAGADVDSEDIGGGGGGVRAGACGAGGCGAGVSLLFVYLPLVVIWKTRRRF